MSHVLLGALTVACAHLEQAIALYAPQEHRSYALLYGRDPGVNSRAYMAWALWLLGYPDQARQRFHDTLSLARELSHPFTLGTTLIFAARVHEHLREPQAAQGLAEAALALATRQGLPHSGAAGTILRGWALAEQGQETEGLAQMHQGLVAFRATGAETARPYYLALLAQVYGKAGNTAEGLIALAEALATVQRSGERWWEAELYRLRGELLLRHAISVKPLRLAGVEPLVLTERLSGNAIF